MEKKRLIKLIHLLGTIWFALCVCYILVLGLRQAGVRWWVIFSFSGQSVVIFFVLVSTYLFAFFKGAGRSQHIQQEHPLSTTDFYMVFYSLVPFLGGLAGTASMIGTKDTTQFLLGVSYGTMGATFLTWVIVDPAVGLVEMLLPECRRHRVERLEKARAQRKEHRGKQRRLLAELDVQERQQREGRGAKLEPLVGKLMELVLDKRNHQREKEQKAAEVGVKAFQIGGLDGMHQLHEMTIERYEGKGRDMPDVDYITQWWDGVCGWIDEPLSERGGLQLK